MNGRVNEIFAKAGEKHGYESVEAEFCDFKDFKIKWSRSYKWARFFVSDYLKDAPAEVVEDIAEVIMGKIAGENADYGPETYAWLTSPEFVALNQPVFIKRCKRGIIEGDTGALEASRERLIKKGLIQADADVKIFWGKESRSSVLMKTAMINVNLAHVEAELLDLAVFMELAIIGRGFHPNEHISREAVAEDYPDASRLMAELAEMGMGI